MEIQRLILKASSYDEMYFRGGSFSHSALQIKAGERVSLDTYFNSLSYTVYKEYTSINKITFGAQLTGLCRIMLCTYDGKNEVVVAEKTDTGCVFLEAELDSLPSGAILYPVFEALCDLSLLGGEYSTATPPNDISIAVAICTYKREQHVLQNAKVLRASSDYISKAFIIDNGGTLESTLSDGMITVLPNKNYGGSGGFTRGIIEAYLAKYSHVILMDDDVKISPELFLRIKGILSYLKPEHKNAHISAAMLSMSKPYLQFELGARFNGSYIEGFKKGLDVRERSALIENLTPDMVEYGAWWCFAMPTSDVTRFGLPLPLFIKFDDVEYGTRCCANAPIITLNGLCVWHEDFDLKYSMHLEYYTIRNQLITLATQGRGGGLNSLLRLLKVSAKHLFLYRYDTMPLIYKAFEDYLRGADFLLNGNEEKLNQEVMALAPKAQPLCEIQGWQDLARDEYEHKKRSFFSKLLQVLTLGGHLIPRFMLKSKPSAFPLPDAKVGSAYLCKKTIQYQLGSDFGYAYNRSVKAFFKHLFKCIGLSFKLLFKSGRAKKSYINKKTELTSLDFWKNHLDI